MSPWSAYLLHFCMHLCAVRRGHTVRYRPVAANAADADGAD